MKKYMVTYKNGFNGGVDYCDTIQEANDTATRMARVGYAPEELYEYNPLTKKYDKRIGSFARTSQK